MGLKNHFEIGTHDFIQASANALLEKGTTAFTLEEFVAQFYQLEPEYAQQRAEAQSFQTCIDQTNSVLLSWVKDSVPKKYLSRSKDKSKLDDILSTFLEGALGYFSSRDDKNVICLSPALIENLEYHFSRPHTFEHFQWLCEFGKNLTKTENTAREVIDFEIAKRRKDNPISGADTRSNFRFMDKTEENGIFNNHLGNLILNNKKYYNLAKSLLSYLKEKNPEEMKYVCPTFYVRDYVSSIVSAFTQLDNNRALHYLEPEFTNSEQYNFYSAFLKTLVKNKDTCITSLRDKERCSVELSKINNGYNDILCQSPTEFNEANVLVLAYKLLSTKEHSQLGTEMLKELSGGLVTTSYYIGSGEFRKLKFQEYHNNKSLSSFSAYLKQSLFALNSDQQLRVTMIPEVYHSELEFKLNSGANGTCYPYVESEMYRTGHYLPKQELVSVKTILEWIDDESEPKYFWLKSGDNPSCTSLDKIDLLYAGQLVHGWVSVPSNILANK